MNMLFGNAFPMHGTKVRTAFLAAAFLSGLILSPQPVCAAGSAKEQAAAETALWRQIGASAPGVYIQGGMVFSFAKAPLDAKLKSRAAAKAKTAAESAAVRQLTVRIAGSLFKDSSEAANLGRYYAERLSIQYRGRFIASNCASSACEAVFCVPMSEMENVKASLEPQEIQSKARQHFRGHAEAYGDFFAENGLQDISALFAVRKASYVNVLMPIVPAKAKVSAAQMLIERRGQAVSAALSELGGSASPAEKVAIASVIALDSPAVFKEALQAAGIKVLDWQPTQPLLGAAAAAQGFVKFDAGMPSEAPLSMPFIRTLFSEGRDLNLAISLLEDAVQRSPACAEVWEYLAAGYFAAGQKDAALICSRVWLGLSSDASVPIQYILTHFEFNPKAQSIAQILNQSD